MALSHKLKLLILSTLTLANPSSNKEKPEPRNFKFSDSHTLLHKINLPNPNTADVMPDQQLRISGNHLLAAADAIQPKDDSLSILVPASEKPAVAYKVAVKDIRALIGFIKTAKDKLNIQRDINLVLDFSQNTDYLLGYTQVDFDNLKLTPKAASILLDKKKTPKQHLESIGESLYQGININISAIDCSAHTQETIAAIIGHELGHAKDMDKHPWHTTVNEIDHHIKSGTIEQKHAKECAADSTSYLLTGNEDLLLPVKDDYQKTLDLILKNLLLAQEPENFKLLRANLKTTGYDLKPEEVLDQNIIQTTIKLTNRRLKELDDHPIYPDRQKHLNRVIKSINASEHRHRR